MARRLLGEAVTADAVGVETVLRVDAGLLLSGAQLSDRLGHWAHINVSDFDALVVVNLERFINNAGWAFDRDGLVGALAAAKLALVSILDRLLLDLSIVSCREGKKILVVTLGLLALLLILIELDGRQELLLGQKGVNLLNELQSCVLFVQNESVDRVERDGDLSAVEEQLKLAPVVALAAVVLCVGERVH